jgi:hypothetical protein
VIGQNNRSKSILPRWMCRECGVKMYSFGPSITSPGMNLQFSTLITQPKDGIILFDEFTSKISELATSTGRNALALSTIQSSLSGVNKIDPSCVIFANGNSFLPFLDVSKIRTVDDRDRLIETFKSSITGFSTTGCDELNVSGVSAFLNDFGKALFLNEGRLGHIFFFADDVNYFISQLDSVVTIKQYTPRMKSRKLRSRPY